MSDWLQAAIYAPIGAIILQLINWYKDRHKDKAALGLNHVEGARAIQGMALDMLEPLKTRINKLETMLKDMETLMDQMKSDYRKEHQGRLDAEFERDTYKRQYERLIVTKGGGG